MWSIVMSEVESFRRSLGDQLAHGDSMLTPEECLDPWRAQDPSGQELEAETEAIREAIDDMKAGEAGQPLHEFLAEFRAEKRISG